MAQFFERNKRKSVLALLFLLIGRRRDLGLTLLMVFVLVFVFILPANFNSLVGQKLLRVPGGRFLAAALGVNQPSFGELLTAFRAARNERQAGWGLFFRTVPGSGAYSSIGMVRGQASDLAGGDLGAKLGGNRTIHGILNRDEAEHSPGGVYLGNGDVAGERAGLVQSAYGLEALGIGAFATRGFFKSGTSAAVPDGVAAALSATQVPGTSPVGAGWGRLSKAAAAQNVLAWTPLAQSVGRGLSATAAGGACLAGGRCAFAQLTTGHANALLASSPICTPGSGCPPEYASTQSGAVYDNNQIGIGAPQVLTSGAAAPQLDGIATPNPNPPPAGTVDVYNQQAAQLQQQEQQCDQADAAYDPQEQVLEDNIQGLSNAMNNLNCGGGGCSAPGQCQSDGNQMKSTCLKLDGVMYQHWLACPIMQQNGPYQHQPCS